MATGLLPVNLNGRRSLFKYIYPLLIMTYVYKSTCFGLVQEVLNKYSRQGFTLFSFTINDRNAHLIFFSK